MQSVHTFSRSTKERKGKERGGEKEERKRKGRNDGTKDETRVLGREREGGRRYYWRTGRRVGCGMNGERGDGVDLMVEYDGEQFLPFERFIIEGGNKNAKERTSGRFPLFFHLFCAIL